MAQGCDVSQILECLTVSGLTGASELLINQNFSVPQIEVYRYGFFAKFRYPILKSCKVPITDN